MNRNLIERTPSEELWLWRRSRGLSQRAAAARLGVGRGRLSRAERSDVLEATRIRPPESFDVPVALLLVLARRRYGKGLRGTADAAGLSHRTLLVWEARADEALIGWWQRRGFTFARERG
jgi:Helix-turn-helix